MPHDGHLVERRLSVEDDDVVVSEVPLHRVPVLQGEAILVAHKAEVHPDPVVSHDVPVGKDDGFMPPAGVTRFCVVVCWGAVWWGGCGVERQRG